MIAAQEIRKQFSFGHIALIGLCAFALLGLFGVKNGFHFGNAQAVGPKSYTYAMALADATHEVSPSDNPQNNRDADQLAMIDPTMTDGSVLGASTGTLDSVIPDAQETFTPEVLSQIKINLLDSTSVQNIQAYKISVANVEAENNSSEILAAMTSSDQKVLAQVSAKAQPLLSALLAIPVPKDLAEYHRMKILYYAELGVLADGYAGKENSADPKQSSMAIFSIFERLQKITDDIQNKYGVSL